ncbi:MAG: nicotinate-nucleotide adenylyltransferase [Sphingomonadales bacterium]
MRQRINDLPDPADEPERWRKTRVGLLGGSFNPAHAGHRHISRAALERLGLDYVWWLVSPQNPLKPAAGMAPLEERLAQARHVADHPRILVTDIERRIGTRYTAQALERLTAMFPTTRFVWLMGADNLRQIDRWRDWADIFRTVPIAIFDRPTYSFRAMAGAAARRFKRFELPQSRARALAHQRPPAWTFIRGGRHPASATAIRAARGRRSDPA